jgi:hypothetical protein
MAGYRALHIQETHREFAGGNNLKKWAIKTLRSKWDDDKMDLKKIICRNGRRMELAEDHIQWQALVLTVLNLQVLLPES